MIEKGCNETCKRVKRFESPVCQLACEGLSKWQPSELYTAYLAEKEKVKEVWEIAGKHAENAMDNYDRAERFRQALACEKCRGIGHVEYEEYNSMATYWKPCRKCADIRKEARDNA